MLAVLQGWGPGSRASSPALPFLSPVDTVCRLECKQRGHPSSRPLYPSILSLQVSTPGVHMQCLRACGGNTLVPVDTTGHRHCGDPPLHPDTWTGSGLIREKNDTSRQSYSHPVHRQQLPQLCTHTHYYQLTRSFSFTDTDMHSLLAPGDQAQIHK